MRHLAILSAALGLLVLGVAFYLGAAIGGVQDSLLGLRDDVQARPQAVKVYNHAPENMKTGTFSKTLEDGTTVTMDYEWDCTPEGWKKIREDWQYICDNS